MWRGTNEFGNAVLGHNQLRTQRTYKVISHSNTITSKKTLEKFQGLGKPDLIACDQMILPNFSDRIPHINTKGKKSFSIHIRRGREIKIWVLEKC
jgi:hypothetical protein